MTKADSEKTVKKVKAKKEKSAKPSILKKAPKELKKAGKADKKADKKSKRAHVDKRRGVLYIGHVPHGFYENQMRKFLSQYGNVARLRISRSTKNGKSRGYAFAQFTEPELAEQVATELNGTYLTGKSLKVEVMDPEKIHSGLWKGMKLTDLMKKDRETRISGRDMHYQTLDGKPVAKRIMELIAKERKRNKELEKAGIDYKFSGFEDQLKELGLQYVPKARNTDATSSGNQAGAAPAKGSKKSKAAKKAAEATPAPAAAATTTAPAAAAAKKSSSKKNKAKKDGKAPAKEAEPKAKSVQFDLAAAAPAAAAAAGEKRKRAAPEEEAAGQQKAAAVAAKKKKGKKKAAN
ncbi:putative RNA-binding protein [Diplonema papillatum]|nr:putative RNA-binding protein [Diplonema papillatum]KAJ9459231.1 putative RNA-binding protein [Diplonema papillatum]